MIDPAENPASAASGSLEWMSQVFKYNELQCVVPAGDSKADLVHDAEKPLVSSLLDAP